MISIVSSEVNMRMILWVYILCSVSYAWSQSVSDTVTVSIDEYKPFTSEYLTDNGVDCRITREAFKIMGVAVEFKYFPTARTYMMAEQGYVDATLPWAKRKGREKKFVYSDAIREADIEHFYYRKSNPIKWNSSQQDYSQLKGLRIGAVIGYNYGERFQDAEKKGVIVVERLPTLKNNFKKLFAGKIDIVISQKLVGDYNLNESFSSKDVELIASILQNSDVVEYDYLLFSKKSGNAQVYAQLFNEGLKKIKKSGLYTSIINGIYTGYYKNASVLNK